MTKREMEDENNRLRERLEEAYDTIGDALGFDDSEEGDGEDEDGESDPSEFDEEE
jgi:hypothetical protein